MHQITHRSQVNWAIFPRLNKRMRRFVRDQLQPGGLYRTGERRVVVIEPDGRISTMMWHRRERGQEYPDRVMKRIRDGSYGVPSVLEAFGVKPKN